MHKSLIAALIFTLTLIAGTLLSFEQNPKITSSVLWTVIGALVCGGAGAAINLNRAKFFCRILMAGVVGFVSGMVLINYSRGCGNTTPEELFWGNVWGVLILTILGVLVGLPAAIYGVFEDRKTQNNS